MAPPRCRFSALLPFLTGGGDAVRHRAACRRRRLPTPAALPRACAGTARARAAPPPRSARRWAPADALLGVAAVDGSSAVPLRSRPGAGALRQRQRWRCAPACAALWDACPVGHGHATPAALCRDGASASAWRWWCGRRRASPLPRRPPRAAAGRGACADGVCVCAPGFAGPSCSSITCPGDCSGHGACDGASGTCRCDAGYVFANCSGWRALARCPRSRRRSRRPRPPRRPRRRRSSTPPPPTTSAPATAPATPRRPLPRPRWPRPAILLPRRGAPASGAAARRRRPACSLTSLPAGLLRVYLRRQLQRPRHLHRHLAPGALPPRPRGLRVRPGAARWTDRSGVACPNGCSGHGACNHSDGAQLRRNSAAGWRRRLHRGGLLAAGLRAVPCVGLLLAADRQLLVLAGVRGRELLYTRLPGRRRLPPKRGLRGRYRDAEFDLPVLSGVRAPLRPALLLPTEAPAEPHWNRTAPALRSRPLPSVCDGLGVGEGPVCCTEAEASAASDLLSELLHGPAGVCAGFWRALVCNIFCAPTQGRYLSGSWAPARLPAPTLVPVPPGPNPAPHSVPEPARARARARLSRRVLCTGKYGSAQCCAAVARSIRCAATQLP